MSIIQLSSIKSVDLSFEERNLRLKKAREYMARRYLDAFEGVTSLNGMSYGNRMDSGRIHINDISLPIHHYSSFLKKPFSAQYKIICDKIEHYFDSWSKQQILESVLKGVVSLRVARELGITFLGSVMTLCLSGDMVSDIFYSIFDGSDTPNSELLARFRQLGTGLSEVEIRSLPRVRVNDTELRWSFENTPISLILHTGKEKVQFFRAVIGGQVTLLVKGDGKQLLSSDDVRLLHQLHEVVVSSYRQRLETKVMGTNVAIIPMKDRPGLERTNRYGSRIPHVALKVNGKKTDYSVFSTEVLQAALSKLRLLDM